MKEIEEIKLPSSLVSIKENAFSSCNLLEQNEISSSLKFLGDCVFKDCSSLKCNFNSFFCKFEFNS